jgi:hypothetical protein
MLDEGSRKSDHPEVVKNPKIGFIVLRSSYIPVTYMTEYSIFYAF